MTLSMVFFLHVCVSGAAAGAPNFLCKSHEMDPGTCWATLERMRIEPKTPAEKDMRVFAYCAPAGGFNDEWGKVKK